MDVPTLRIIWKAQTDGNRLFKTKNKTNTQKNKTAGMEMEADNVQGQVAENAPRSCPTELRAPPSGNAAHVVLIVPRARESVLVSKSA